MKLRVEQITSETATRDIREPASEINDRLATGEMHDFRLVSPLEGEVSFYRAGEELYFEGQLSATVEGTCARCLETFSSELHAPFEFVLTRALPDHETHELHAEDLSFSFYTGDEIDLMPLFAEQAILALPTRALCREECLGLCPACGANRNVNACDCEASGFMPRLGMLRDLKSRSGA